MWLLLLQLAVWQPVHYPVLHQGHWQSCDGAERVLQHTVMRPVKPSPYYKLYHGVPPYETYVVWELHLGPDDEFALYDHAVDGDHAHADRANLLAPGYTYEGRLGKAWTVPKLHLWVNVVRGGGSRDECAAHAFYIQVRTQ